MVPALACPPRFCCSKLIYPHRTIGTRLEALRSQHRQRLLEVRTEVVGGLDAHGHANQPVANAEARPFLRGESRVRHSGWPHDQRMHTAQAGRDDRDSEASHTPPVSSSPPRTSNPSTPP